MPITAVADVAATRERLRSVDLVRGFVMVVMALDHTREFLTSAHFDPTDLTQTSAVLFFTRWITHFCAPVFFLLAGTGASLAVSRGMSRSQASRFLLTRGLWLLVLEFTVVQFAWFFTYHLLPYYGLVIWALGWSMVAMAALVYLPVPAIAGVGIVIIAGHNLLDSIEPSAFGSMAWVWTVLHVPGQIGDGSKLNILYPVLPWIGVMAAGYALGTVLTRGAAERRSVLLRLGVALISAFVVLRGLNLYGDASEWSAQASGLFSALSFLNTTKYPPSLLFLLMTLGPALIALALFDRASGPLAAFFIVFGRVPMFYYVLHLYLIHTLAVAAGLVHGDPVGFLFQNITPDQVPLWWGFGLPVVYAVWLLAIVILYPMCHWFAEVKRRRRDWWLSYV